ncbi:hypothetical protein PsYK624_040980 [Phanerochaete sordida]|uniref:Uncharacterized protein n=1 Tax=Phanerochaete sordida TaxID=48140 RepID=A0A9P3LAB9_9APHY|nr:hypothetical protein PsYK624_040980 [Phanerochaete sordida]
MTGLSRREASTVLPRDSDGIPEIGGSSAGFIILVVVLAAIFILCSIGVFFLLRSHREDPYERHARRVLSGRREDITYQMPLGPPGLKEKFKSLFRMRGGGGWVRASSGDDEWDASDPEARGRPYDPPSGHRAGDSRWGSDSQATLSKSNFGVHKSDTLESIELSAPALKNVTLPTLSYSDPYSSPPPPMEGSVRSTGLESPRQQGIGKDPSYSGLPLPTDRAPPTFENGTRFKESL